MNFFSVFLASSLITFSAFANDGVRQKIQAIGEQCSVISNYQEPEAGECGGGEVAVGDAQVSGLMGVEKNKTYYAKFTLINDNDEVEEVVRTDNYYATRDDNWIIDNYYIALSRFGKYAVKLEIFNANTDTAICTAQSFINAAK